MFSPPQVIVPPGPLISSFGRYATGVPLASAASATWSLAKRVIYVPVYLPQSMTATLLWWLNGATVGTDTVEAGIYNSAAGLPTTKIVSSGTGVTSAGANIVQSIDITDTFLAPGLYFLALTASGTTTTIWRFAPSNALLKGFGLAAETTGTFGCPSTATPTSSGLVAVPMFGFATVTTI